MITPAQRRITQQAWNLAHRDELRAYKKAWDAAHRDKLRAYFKAYHVADRPARNIRSRTHYAANRDASLAVNKRWRDAHPGAAQALRARRRAAEARATPVWADLVAIRAIYAEAERLTLTTGVSHEVDHRYPLRGKLVSGLHVAENLQILTRVENRRKHNKHPDRLVA